MSGNSDQKPELRPATAPAAPARAGPSDRRVRRTRDTLGDALVDLMQSRPFDDITVQDLLDRANVSRSTFYTHFRDKQDLFLSDVEDFFEHTANLLTRNGAPAHRIVPVKELFAHVAEVRDFHSALIASGKWIDVRELGQGYFARSIEQRLAQAGARLSTTEFRGTAHALAGALFSLLEWWLDSNKQASPAEMDALFHSLTRSVLAP